MRKGSGVQLCVVPRLLEAPGLVALVELFLVLPITDS